MLSACAASIKFAPHAVTFRTVIRFTGKAPHVSLNDCIYYFTSNIISKSVFKSQESNFKKVAQKNNRLLLTPFHLPLPSFFAARPCTFHPKMLYSRQIKSAVSIAYFKYADSRSCKTAYFLMRLCIILYWRSVFWTVSIIALA